MKKQVILLFAFFIGANQLIAQTTPSQKMDEFIKQKADGFNTSYENRDIKTFNALLTEYLLIY